MGRHMYTKGQRCMGVAKVGVVWSFFKEIFYIFPNSLQLRCIIFVLFSCFFLLFGFFFLAYALLFYVRPFSVV